MDFKSLDIRHSYISYGPASISDSLLNPALKHTKIYKRSVGFFSSGVLKPIFEGIVALAKNKGRIELIASPQLSTDDINAINTGYEHRAQIIDDCFTREFLSALNEFEDKELKILVELIARGYLDIKIAVTKNTGIYHDKLGILEDFDGNAIAFYGSPNSSYSGYKNNYEKIRVARSWIPGEEESVADEQAEFNALWNGTNPYVDVFDYDECAKVHLLEAIDNRGKSQNNSTGIKLRDYQEEAIKSWIDNDYHGFLVMATGTGKTWTAIYAAKELTNKRSCLIVICAPYKHLVKQWAEDVEKAFPKAKIILISSENPSWETQLSKEIIRKTYYPDTQIIAISTIASFNSDRFTATIEKSTENKLLIVDEAHRFTNRPEGLHSTYQYMLGLSATPFSGKSAASGKELMDYFGGQVFSLTIEDALARGYLVPYYYHPIYVYATDYEEQQFRSYTQKILSCFKNNICIDPDLLVKSLRNRLRVISMASEKQRLLPDIVSKFEGKDHFVVYCGDGRLFDDNGSELRHIQAVKNILTDHDFRVSQFTAKENMAERIRLVEAFNKGDISGLAAIRCLDEGINIPSIESALILSSNDDYREFVQRRGRILRTYKGKEHAEIFDIIVLPSMDTIGWAIIEFRRFKEYAKLALNADALLNELQAQLSCYGLTFDDIRAFEYEDIEVNPDE